MHDDASFWNVVWQRLRPYALSQIVDFGQYTLLWTTVLGAHAIRLLMATAGIEPEIVAPVAWLEKWVFIASFLGLFARVLLRIFASFQGPLQ